nr:MAG TPA: hypothetical protein [Caudoviricetes sp.]
MITVAELKDGLGDWLQTRLMPRLDGKRQFLLGTIYGVGAGKMDTIISAAAENGAVKALGIVQPDGRIDIDTLYNAALAQMQAQGKVKIDLPLLGTFAFDADDLRELRQCIAGRENA